jgi:SAM-dependent methyltransferase
VISHPDLLESATAARSVALPEPRIGVDYAEFLLEVLHDAQRWGPNHAALLRQMELQTERLLLGPARAFEATASIERMTQATKRCRDLLRPIWERGAIGYEITHWPRGPGSAAAMELIYRNEYPTSDLSAHYTEWFLLTRDLAHAVRSRKDLLLQHLVGEINARRGAVRILDVACGPCQSLREALPQLRDVSRVELQGIDTDELQQLRNSAFFQRDRGLDFSFVTKNALRAEYAPDCYDIIYSTGLYDYLADRSLERLWKRTYQALKPGGVGLFSMKDSTRYCTLFYRWAIEWNQFQLRSAPDILSIARQAGLPCPEVARDASGVIMLLIVRKPA